MKPSERDDLIKETHQALLGIKGTEDKGLVGDFKNLSKSHYNLRRNFWYLVGVLTGLGIIGGGLYGLFNGV